ncbi:hypothetical protein B0A50_06729 [Salinomyces thailandicus]|uniref:Fe2OG dioxygenase domain-containing protein n=1 Tax=Salinomyces thailandicus TaxID=706561 RepID=A0A4V5N582_9PEZI|nr:hypothetical protein B0A50_06729 [Salinomyces thailandica]
MDEYLIANAPASMFYIPDFITEAEEQHILQSIPVNKWITLSHRRLQAIPTRLSSTNTLLASPLPPWLVHPILDRFKDLAIFADAPHGVNHCLINEYLPGQGIMPHEDGAAYHPVVATVSLGSTVVLDVTQKASIQDADLDRNPDAQREQEQQQQQQQKQNTSSRILQEPRSLLLTTEPAYTTTLHGIASTREDLDLNPITVANWNLLPASTTQRIEANGGRNLRETRVSLTFRDVRKVSKLGGMVFGKGRA